MNVNMKIKNNSEEIAILQLINRHFWKSKIGPISSLAIPLFLMIIYKILSKDLDELFASGLPSYFSFSILPLCFISLPQMLVEFKTSIILRKISTSKISSINFIFLLISYNLLAIMASSIIIILLCLAFLNVNAIDYFKTINWLELIYVLLNIYICSLSLGLLLGIVINKIGLVQSIGFCIIIVSITFSGQFIPISVLFRSDATAYISLFSPISYSLNLLNIVLLPHNKDMILEIDSIISHLPSLDAKFEELKNYQFNGIFDIHNTFKIFDFAIVDIDEESGIKTISKLSITTIYKPWQNIINLIIPYVISTSFILISIKNFKWTSR